VAFNASTSASSVAQDALGAAALTAISVKLSAPVRFQYSSSITSPSTQCSYADSVTQRAFLGTYEYYPWFAVDLGAVYALTDVQLWARTGQEGRLANTKLLVSQTPLVPAPGTLLSASLACFSVGASSATSVSGPCAATGRYVVLQSQNQAVLDLCAIQLFGSLLPPAQPPPPSPPPSPPLPNSVMPYTTGLTTWYDASTAFPAFNVWADKSGNGRNGSMVNVGALQSQTAGTAGSWCAFNYVAGNTSSRVTAARIGSPA
jgi:hypothetical protein